MEKLGFEKLGKTLAFCGAKHGDRAGMKSWTPPSPRRESTRGVLPWIALLMQNPSYGHETAWRGVSQTSKGGLSVDIQTSAPELNM